MPDRFMNLVFQQAVHHSLKAQIKDLKVKTAYFRRLLTNDFRNNNNNKRMGCYRQFALKCNARQMCGTKS